jgi:hypothetical protein
MTVVMNFGNIEVTKAGRINQDVTIATDDLPRTVNANAGKIDDP